MANQPYLPLYTGDWKKDDRLSMCSLATRGAWIDLLCSMHDGRIGQVTGTPQQLSRLCRCDAAEMNMALLELQATGAADVNERNGIFTVICRRLKRVADISKTRADAGRKGGAKAKQRERIPEYENEDEGLRKVREFARGEGITQGDADFLFWKWHANDWQNNGSPIRDWKATVRSWQRAGYLPSQKNGRLPSQRAPAAPPKDIPDPMRSWLIEHYPDKREQIQQWKITTDIPQFLRDEWFRCRKKETI